MPRDTDQPKIYRYILRHDDGMAPCVDDGLITLATCKPTIRRCSSIGDWVLGFYGRSHREGTLAWAGKIQKKIYHGEYQRSYADRSDAVYREDEDGNFIRLRPGYHPSQKELENDVSNPVLIFDRKFSWYFGSGPHLIPENLMNLAASGQGHRVNSREPGDLDKLMQWLGDMKSGIQGKPRDLDCVDGCARPRRPLADNRKSC